MEAEARHRWLNEATNLARGVILGAVRDGDVNISWKLLERTERRLQARAAVEHHGFVDIEHSIGNMSTAELAALCELSADELSEVLNMGRERGLGHKASTPTAKGTVSQRF